MQRWVRLDLLKGLQAEYGTVHDQREHLVQGPVQRLAAALDQTWQSLPQVVIVVGDLEIQRLPSGGMQEVAMHGFVRVPNAGTPSFENFLYSGVMLGVRVQIQIGGRLGSQPPSVQHEQCLEGRFLSGLG